jgi:hypothetical protein
MKNFKTLKEFTKKPLDHIQINNVIAFSLLFILGIYLYLVFYRKVYYPAKQFFRKKNESGYIIVKGIFEHRLLAEQWLGRKLSPDEEVHHINGKKWDNSRKNLAVLTRENHLNWHKRLDWMFSKKMFPKISTQRKKLVEDFDATLF